MDIQNQDVISYFKQRVGLYAEKHGREIAEHSASIEACNKHGISMDRFEELMEVECEE